MLLEKFFKIMNMEITNKDISSLTPSAEFLVQQVSEFHYHPEADKTFTNWLEECGNVF